MECINCRTLNDKINKFHERALRILYKDNNASFEEILEKDKSITIHRNIKLLAKEMYKVNIICNQTFWGNFLLYATQSII